MLTSFFASKDEPSFLLSNAKIIETTYNNIPCSKITLKSGTTAQYEVFKSVNHPNILPIFKLSAHSIYTKRITPLSVCLEKDKKKYNKKIILKIKQALDYLHDSLKREHRSFSIESIFIDSSGMPFLGNFEKSSIFVDKEEDMRKLNSLALEIVGENLSDFTDEVDFIESMKSLQIDNYGEENILDVVLLLDSSFLSKLKTEERQSLLNKICSFKNELPLITVKNIFKIFISDLERDPNKEYKVYVLEKLLSLDRTIFIENKNFLFSVIDSTVRMFLLKTFSKYSEPMDEISPDLSLGLRVKEKSIKIETIDFIFKNKFGNESLEFLFENMLACTDSDSISLICTHLLAFNKEGLSKSIYKLIIAFLNLNKAIPLVLKVLEKHYTSFDKVKISKEILPHLCTHLLDKENQEQCFELIEKIVRFLKEHKEEIYNREWKLKHISKVFNKKEDQKDKFEKRVSKFTKEDMNEWEGCDII